MCGARGASNNAEWPISELRYRATVVAGNVALISQQQT